ncbi:MAG: DUF6249 domain-containing protein [Acidobacteriota bacterium]
MGEDEVVFISRLMVLPAILIVGGVVVMIATIIRNGKVAEMRHLERMAMIERGITPPEAVEMVDGARRAYGFKLTLGIMLCGFGLGLGMLITFAAAEEGVALGVGGAFVMLGLAFIAAAFVPGRGREISARPDTGSLTPPPGAPPAA